MPSRATLIPWLSFPEITFLAASGLAGDFNNDGSVDAADHVVWRKGLGTIYTQAAYNVWRAHFGQTAASGAALASAQSLPAVPEPASISLLVLGAISILRRRQSD